MAKLSRLAALLLVSTACVSACAAPEGGCSPEVCASYAGLTLDSVIFRDADYSSPATWQKGNLPKIGNFFGTYNKHVNGGVYDLKGDAGFPALNLERYSLETDINDPETGMPYATPTAELDLASCCTKCANTDGCHMFQFYPAESPTGVSCYLLSGGSVKSAASQGGVPYTGSAEEQLHGALKNVPMSFVGGKCSGVPSESRSSSAAAGSRSVKLAKQGQIEKSFCLTSDEKLHINALLKGYRDKRPWAGKAVRSWIKELGILWMDEAGKQHRLHLVARSGKRQERGNGFLASATLDGNAVPVPAVAGSTFERANLELGYTGSFRKGPFDVDYFQLKVKGLLDLSLSLTVAHPKLQTPKEAHVHFSMMFNNMAKTQKLHGVLGQGYRGKPRALAAQVKQSHIARLLAMTPQAGDLEGKTVDYITSSVVSPDCRFRVF